MVRVCCRWSAAWKGTALKRASTSFEYLPSGRKWTERKARRRILPPRAVPACAAAEDKQQEFSAFRLAGDWGSNKPNSLRGPHRLRPAPHRASTMTFAAAYPFLTESGLGHEGTYIGTDVFGSGAFSYDPWILYDKGIISGPSIVVIGTVGTGKSMCGKSLVTRSITLGRKAAVASDPKGEWVAVAEAVGGKVISIGPGRPARVNPLDAGPRSTALTEAQWQAVVRQRRRYLLGALVSLMRQGTPLRPVEHTALDIALMETMAENSDPTLPMVLDHLLKPSKEMTALVGSDGATAVSHSLRRTVSGDLEGMFDAPSTVAFDADAPMMVMDTSALIGASEQALSLAAACGATWLEAAITNPDGGKRLVVYDEGWRIDRKSTRLNSSHIQKSRMPSSA